MENTLEQILQEQFLNIAKIEPAVDNNEIKIISQLKNFLDKPQNSQYIHFSHLKKAAYYCHNKEVRQYLTQLKQEHTNSILFSIYSNNVSFLENHFIDWFNSYYKVNAQPNYKVKKYIENKFYKHFYEACTSSSNEVVKYFLSNTDLIEGVKSKIDITKDENKTIKIAYSQGNIELFKYFLNLVRPHINTIINSIDCDDNASTNKEMKLFVKQYREDLISIAEYLKEYKVFDIELIKEIVNSPLLIQYPYEQQKLLTNICVESCKVNNYKLIDYLFNTDEINVKPDIFYNNQEIFLEACHYNSIECLEVLLKEYKKHEVFNKAKNKNILPFEKAGIILATQCNCYDTVEFLCDIPNYLTPILIKHCIKEANSRGNNKITELLLEKLVK